MEIELTDLLRYMRTYYTTIRKKKEEMRGVYTPLEMQGLDEGFFSGYNAVARYFYEKTTDK